MDLLEKAAESNEVIHVKPGQQRCIGKTPALIYFARKNKAPVLMNRQLRVSGCSWQDADIVEALGNLGDYGLHNLLAVERIARVSEVHLYSRVKGLLHHSYESLGIKEIDENGEFIAPKLLWKENLNRN